MFISTYMGIANAAEYRLNRLKPLYRLSRQPAYLKVTVQETDTLLLHSQQYLARPSNAWSQTGHCRVLHFNVMRNPAAEWTARQITEAFPYDQPPRYLLRDRDSIYGQHFRQRVRNMGIEEVVTSWCSPWQNPYVEQMIGSICRECFDHAIVLNEKHLRKILASYFEYYNNSRTHPSFVRSELADPPKD